MDPTGSRTKQLEKNIAEWIGTEKCVCLNSQTACAEMALHIMGIGEGDEVITSAYTYTASASVIAHVGADIFERGLCLPSDNKMTNDEQNTVIEIIKSCFD